LTEERDYEKELKTPASLRSDRVAESSVIRWRLAAESHGGIAGIGMMRRSAKKKSMKYLY
jgi:hypothetical protein